MKILTKKIKKVLTWEDFKNGLSRAGFNNESNQLYRPEWMCTKTHDGVFMLAVPGDENKKSIVGSNVLKGDIHYVWFSVKVEEFGKKIKYNTSPVFPASMLA